MAVHPVLPVQRVQPVQSVQPIQSVQFSPLSSMPRLSRGPTSPSSPSSPASPSGPSHMYYNRGRLLSRKQPSVVVSGTGVPGLFRCGDVGKQLIQRALKGQQLLLDILQLLDGDKPLVHAISIVAYLCLGGIQFQSLLLNQIIDFADGLDVARRIVADVLLVTARLDDGEL